eukprot:2039944-Pyramimonas_sp.AAC.1
MGLGAAQTHSRPRAPRGPRASAALTPNELCAGMAVAPGGPGWPPSMVHVGPDRCGSISISASRIPFVCDISWRSHEAPYPSR